MRFNKCPRMCMMSMPLPEVRGAGTSQMSKTAAQHSKVAVKRVCIGALPAESQTSNPWPKKI